MENITQQFWLAGAMMSEAVQMIQELQALATPSELPKIRKRLSEDEPAFGLRMRDLFDAAKSHTDMDLDQVERLLEHPTYEPRMAAFCILDFKARRKLSAQQRRELCDLYVQRHDRITTWDMVDRSAPRVVGGYVTQGPYDLLYELARADAPLRRRSAITAPLYFIRTGTEEDLKVGFGLAEQLATDPEPVVHNAVGIFLKHAGSRDPDRLHAFLSTYAETMPGASLRLAIEKLEPDVRSSFLRRR